MNIDFEHVLEEVRVVDSERKYWFVRSYSGKLYDDYFERNYVGIGFNAIPYKYIHEAHKDDEATFERLKNSLKSNYNLEKASLTSWANQLIDFEHELKDNDMVIIPSENSDDLAFGLVEGGTYIKKENLVFEHKEKNEPYPEKRKKIKWLRACLNFIQ